MIPLDLSTITTICVYMLSTALYFVYKLLILMLITVEKDLNLQKKYKNILFIF